MKKIILLLSVLLTSVCAAWALTPEEIVGKWQSNEIKQEATPNGPAGTDKYIIEFKADNTAKFVDDSSISLESPEMGARASLFIKVEAEANYTVEGDSITFTMVPEKIKVKFTEDDVRVTGANLEASMVTAMQQELYQAFAPGFEQAPEKMAETPIVINEVLVMGKKMTCKMDGEYVNFKRK